MRLQEYIQMKTPQWMNEKNKSRETPVADSVIAAIRAGANSYIEVAEKTGLSESAARSALSRLKRAGKVRLVHRWEVANPLQTSES
jgi:DNA-binding transcriptional ArsR family regulator